MKFLYTTIIYQPLLNALVFLYQTVAFHDLGIAIILLTILIRVVLFPIFQKSVRYQMLMQHLQPKLKQAQEVHKGDYEKQSQAMMAIYREHNLNPFSGIFLLIIQLPILIALYHIFLNALQPEVLQSLYSFVSVPTEINPSFLGLINLQEKNMLMVGLAAIAQYFQGKLALTTPQNPQQLSAAEKMSRRMLLIAPGITLLIFFNLPAAVSLYWLVASLFSIFQQIIINRQIAHGKFGNLPQKTA